MLASEARGMGKDVDISLYRQARGQQRQENGVDGERSPIDEPSSLR
jgi:hypothetical protein